MRKWQISIQPSSVKGQSPAYSIFNPRELLAVGGLATVTPPFVAAWMSSGETPVLVPLPVVAPPRTVPFPAPVVLLSIPAIVVPLHIPEPIVPLPSTAAAAKPVLEYLLLKLEL